MSSEYAYTHIPIIKPLCSDVKEDEQDAISEISCSLHV